MPPKKKIATHKVQHIKGLLSQNHISTLCEIIKCPNIGECFTKPTLTIILLGDKCSRNCLFCSLKKGTPDNHYFGEPRRIAETLKKIGIVHTVLNSACRDDLADSGAYHFASCMHEIKSLGLPTSIEVLIPDLKGNTKALKTIISMNPDIINHNIKTIPRLYPSIRSKADYHRSLKLLRAIKRINPDIISKSGLMVGLGETKEEVTETIQQLREAKCDILNIDHYIQTGRNRIAVKEFVTPEVFIEYKEFAQKLGFMHVESAPFARSCYHSGDPDCLQTHKRNIRP
ncbi:MAG: lipoyl synthase [bacterium]